MRSGRGTRERGRITGPSCIALCCVWRPAHLFSCFVFFYVENCFGVGHTHYFRFFSVWLMMAEVCLISLLNVCLLVLLCIPTIVPLVFFNHFIALVVPSSHNMFYFAWYYLCWVGVRRGSLREERERERVGAKKTTLWGIKK